MTTTKKLIGVREHHGKYQARISMNGKRYSLGTFTDKQRAAHEYNKAAMLVLGDKAVLNPVGPPKQLDLFGHAL